MLQLYLFVGPVLPRRQNKAYHHMPLDVLLFVGKTIIKPVMACAVSLVSIVGTGETLVELAGERVSS